MNFIGDVAVSPDGRTVLAADLFHDRVLAINAQSGQVTGALKTGRRPYRILFHPDGQSYFVSSWADASVYEYSLPSGTEMARVRVGAHPTDLVLSNRKIPDEQNTWQYRLFVAAANTNDVFVVGVSEGKELNVLETLNAGFSALAPAGMTPSGLALSADQTRLLHRLFRCERRGGGGYFGNTQPLAGFVPAGAYPTAVRVLNGGQTRGAERPQRQPVRDRCSDGRNAAGVHAQGDGADALSRVVFGFPARAALVDRACDLHFDGRSVFRPELPPSSRASSCAWIISIRPAIRPAAALNWAVAAIAPDFTERLAPSFAAGRLRYNGFEGGEPANLPPAGYLVEQRAVGGLDGAQLRSVRR